MTTDDGHKMLLKLPLIKLRPILVMNDSHYKDTVRTCLALKTFLIVYVLLAVVGRQIIWRGKDPVMYILVDIYPVIYILNDLEADSLAAYHIGVILRKVTSLPFSQGDRTYYNLIVLFSLSLQ